MKAFIAAAFLMGCAAAQDASRQPDTRRSFGLVATRAVANFRSADSIEAGLRADGATLHPQLIALRLRIEAALDEVQAAIDKSDFDGARESIQRAEALLDRFARRLTGG